MSASPATPAPFDLATFGIHEMLRCGLALRQAAHGAATVEAATRAMVAYLYDAARDPATGERSCALVRCFVTQPFGRLPPALQAVARRGLGMAMPHDDMRCLTLLATMGDDPAWCARERSRGHRAIPLAGADMVRAAPMIAQLLQSFGIAIDAFVAPRREAAVAPPRSYDVFHVPNALGSPVIPAQAEFVVPHRIRSVLGFGAALATGDVAAMILFSRAEIPAASAARFRNIALDVRASLHSYGAEQVFDA